MTDISPMSRDEKLLRKLLGQSIQTDPPQSRIELLLKQIIDEGGVGGGSYKIRDEYATLADLEAAHPTGEAGDAYLVGDPTHIYIWLTDSQQYADGGLFAAVPGEDGNGIVSIEKTSTSGLVDTYTITYTDGNTDTFDVTNGAEGVGITDISKTSTVGNVDTYTITLSNGDTYDFTVTNGGGVPSGGTTGHVLAKKSDADGDVEWVDQTGGSDYSSQIESLSNQTSELASETGSLSTENSTQTSEINSLSDENSAQSSELSSLSQTMSEVVSEISSMSVSDIASELSSLTSENSTQESEIGSLAAVDSVHTSELSSLSQSMSEIASAAASTSASQSELDSTQNAALGSLASENSTQTSEIGSMASEMASMSVSDITSQLSSLSTENSTQESEIGSLAAVDSAHTSELGSLSQSMSELASAASSTSAAQSEIDLTQNSSLGSLSAENSTAASELASLSTENSTQSSEIDSLSTASSEMASELDVIGSEVADKQDELVEGPGIDIDSTTHEIKTERVVFEGTLQAWEALTTAEKKAYTDAIITNDEQTGLVDQVPTENSNNLVTSGGVFDAISDKTSINDSSTSSTTQTWSASKIYSETSYKLLASLVSIGGQNVAFNFEQNKLKIMLTLNASTKVLLQFSADPTTDGYKVAFYVTNDGEQSWQTYWSIPS